MLSGIVLRFLVEELKDLVGKRVKKIVFWEKIYRFQIGKENFYISIDSEMPICARADIEIEGTDVMRNLWSKRLNTIETIGWERILKLGIGRDDLFFLLAKRARLSKKMIVFPHDDRSEPDRFKKSRFKTRQEIIESIKGIDLVLADHILKTFNLKNMMESLSSKMAKFDIKSNTILPAVDGRYKYINDAAIVLLKKLIATKKVRIDEKKEKFLKRKRERIKKRIEMIGNPEILKLKGDAIRTYPDLITGIDGEIELPNPRDPKEKLKIKLNPSLSPQNLAQHYYQRYKKQKKSLENLKRMLKKPIKIKEKGEKPLPYHRFQTKTGLEILVGKNARSNELITFKLARPKDIFLHIRGYTGAHVILRTGGRKPSKQDIEEAAGYAVRFSKARHSTHLPVSYALRADIKRGKTPGTIIFKKEKVLFADPGSGLNI